MGTQVPIPLKHDSSLEKLGDLDTKKGVQEGCEKSYVWRDKQLKKNMPGSKSILFSVSSSAEEFWLTREL